MKRIIIGMIVCITLLIVGCVSQTQIDSLDSNKNEISEKNKEQITNTQKEVTSVNENKPSLLDSASLIYECDFSKSLCDFDISVYECEEGTCQKTDFTENSLDTNSLGFTGNVHQGLIYKNFDTFEDKIIKIILKDITPFPNYRVHIFKNSFDEDHRSGSHTTYIHCKTENECEFTSEMRNKFPGDVAYIDSPSDEMVVIFDGEWFKYYLGEEEIMQGTDLFFYYSQEMTLSIPFSSEEKRADHPYRIKSIEVYQRND